MVHDNLALLFLHQNRLDEAEAKFGNVLRLAPPPREVRLTLDNLGIIRARQGKVTQTVEYFTRALALDETLLADARNNVAIVRSTPAPPGGP